MNKEFFESNEKLEQMEASVLENIDEVTPIEQNEVEFEAPCSIEEPQVEMSTCSCLSSCGSNYSRNGECSCLSSCGSNHNKG